jgi:N-methylhydantoinase A/oxoprolinase/acetone carboxylase beta subunit
VARRAFVGHHQAGLGRRALDGSGGGSIAWIDGGGLRASGPGAALSRPRWGAAAQPTVPTPHACCNTSTRRFLGGACRLLAGRERGAHTCERLDRRARRPTRSPRLAVTLVGDPRDHVSQGVDRAAWRSSPAAAAGPQHAIARALECPRVLIRTAEALSAFGQYSTSHEAGFQHPTDSADYDYAALQQRRRDRPAA